MDPLGATLAQETPTRSSLFSMLQSIAEDQDEADEDSAHMPSAVPADDVRRFINSGIMGFTCGEEDDPASHLPQTGYKKERKRVSTICSKCGGNNVKNLGGATRETPSHPAKYKCYCPDCGDKCLRNRDPNDDGSYTETPSNFAIEGEKKRCSYKCGKCGQEKKGHVCTGKTPQLPAIVNAEHVIKKAKTLIGDAAAAEGAEPEGAEPEGAEPEGAEPEGEEGEEGEEGVGGEHDALASMEPEDDAVEGSTDTEDTTNQAAASVIDSKPTLLALASQNMIQDAIAPRNGHVALNLLGLKRLKVKGDGSCWVYAMLCCAGLLESAHPKVEQIPSPRDRGMDETCRKLSWAYLHDHADLLSPAEKATLDNITDELPQHPMVDDDDYGSFGNINTIRGLAAYFDVTVVCWNQKTLRNPVALQQVVIHEHDSNAPFRMSERYMNAAQIVTMCKKDQRVMHIEWNGVNHYAALVGAAPTPINPHIKTGLMHVSPVTTVNPKSFKPTIKLMPTPKGYRQFANLYRNDISAIEVPKRLAKAPLPQLIDMAEKLKYQGVAFFRKANGPEVRCFCNLPPGNYTPSDFGKTGDFASNLFVSAKFMTKHADITPSSDNGASCKCGIYYDRKMDEVQCTLCGTWNHAACVTNGDKKKLDNLEEFATNFICESCVE